MTDSTRITLTSADGHEFGAYVSRPAKLPAPAVIVIQEIFGVNLWLRSVADWLAESGFLAVAPDLFFRLEPGIELTDKTQAEWDRAFELYKAFDENQGAEDLKSVLAQVRKLSDCNGQVGAMGFCLGGKLAYLMSCRTESDCNVGYYGVGIENNLNETVGRPLMLHIAEADPYVPPTAQEAIKNVTMKNTLVTIHSYAGMNHAFGRPGSDHYDKDAAELAHKRTLAFLQQHLKVAAAPGVRD